MKVLCSYAVIKITFVITSLLCYHFSHKESVTFISSQNMTVRQAEAVGFKNGLLVEIMIFQLLFRVLYASWGPENALILQEYYHFDYMPGYWVCLFVCLFVCLLAFHIIPKAKYKDIYWQTYVLGLEGVGPWTLVSGFKI